MFNVELAKALPKLEITNVSVTAVKTSPDSATHDVIETRTIGRTTEFFVGSNETRTITLRVHAGASDAHKTFNVRLSSTRGGQADREVKIEK
jgi:hypothetical protein